MSLLKYKRLVMLLKERHKTTIVTELQLRRAIMEIFGTDERTIRGIIKKCEELELIKATRNYQLTNEQVDEII